MRNLKKRVAQFGASKWLGGCARIVGPRTVVLSWVGAFYTKF